MRKIKAFTLMEVVLALLLLSIVMISLIPIFGQVDLTSKRLEKKEALYQESINLMETCLSKEIILEGKYCQAKITPYNTNFELVEIYEKDSDKRLLFAIREK